MIMGERRTISLHDRERWSTWLMVANAEDFKLTPFGQAFGGTSVTKERIRSELFSENIRWSKDPVVDVIHNATDIVRRTRGLRD
jgi:hypothetical protein